MARQSGNAWRSRRSRRDETPAPQQAPEPELASRIESAVLGLSGLFTGAARALWKLIAAPRTFPDAIAEQRKLGLGIRPFTFLTLCAFVSIRAMRAFITGLALLFIGLGRACTGPSMDQLEPPDDAELLKIPSIEEVLSIGVPSVLLVLLALVLVRKLLQRGAFVDAPQDRFYEICCYIVGFQYLLLLLTIGASSLAIDKWMPVLLALAVLWPAALFAMQLPSVIPRDINRLVRGKWFTRVATGCAAILMSLLTIAAGVSASIPYVRSQLDAYANEKPILELALIDTTSNPGQASAVTLLLTNNSKHPLALTPKYTETDFGGGTVVPAASNWRITSWKGADAKVVILAPGETGWLTAVEGVAGSDAGIENCHFPHRDKDAADEIGFLCLESLTASGGSRRIYAAINRVVRNSWF